MGSLCPRRHVPDGETVLAICRSLTSTEGDVSLVLCRGREIEDLARAKEAQGVRVKEV